MDKLKLLLVEDQEYDIQSFEDSVELYNKDEGQDVIEYSVFFLLCPPGAA